MDDKDIQIPPPQQQATPAPAAAPTAQTDVPSIVIPISPEQAGLSGNQIVLGVGISIALAILFWFVGRIVADTLVKQFAEVGAAKRAGLSLFAFLTILGSFATFGFLGKFWLANMFIIPAASLSSLMFIVFIYTLVASNKSKRR